MTRVKKRDLKRKVKQSDRLENFVLSNWTRKEHENLISTLQKEGKCWKKIIPAVGTKSKNQIQKYMEKLTRIFKEDPTRFQDGAHLLDLLESKASFFWTPEEKDSWLRAFETHGKNWTEVMKCVPTKSRKEVIAYGYSLAARIKKDPST